MAKIPVFTAVRVISRDSDFLNRRIGSKGELFYDGNANTLRLFNGESQGGIGIADVNLSNVSNSAFAAKANAAGISGGGNSGPAFELSIAADDSTIIPVESGNTLQFLGGSGITTASTVNGEITIANSSDIFSTITVSGQDNVVASGLSDSLNLVAGTNITITTDQSTNSITFNSTATGELSNSFSTISVSTQGDVIADSATDTLTLIAGTGITITTNPTNDSITFTNTLSTLSFDQLSDATTAALDIDQIYLPAITMLVVSNNGASAYRFDQYGSTDNPQIYAINGTTIAFKLTAQGHPFLIQTSAGTNYNTGLVHVATNGTVSTGASAQGKDTGTLYWKIPIDIAGSYRYQCSVHAPMVGNITIKTFATI